MKMGDKVRRNEDGTVTVMAPQGSRKDEKAKINAFKLHEGASAAYGVHDPQYEWVESRRDMGIFHEVQPAEMALDCLDCHREGGRMDWKALGYEADPLLESLD
jgi:hypothetical protein